MSAFTYMNDSYQQGFTKGTTDKRAREEAGRTAEAFPLLQKARQQVVAREDRALTPTTMGPELAKYFGKQYTDTPMTTESRDTLSTKFAPAKYIRDGSNRYDKYGGRKNFLKLMEHARNRRDQAANRVDNLRKDLAKAVEDGKFNFGPIENMTEEQKNSLPGSIQTLRMNLLRRRREYDEIQRGHDELLQESGIPGNYGGAATPTGGAITDPIMMLIAQTLVETLGPESKLK